tara:strand:+ start:1288 stop:1503 length:216 start_codon:yes stop_codon:yes gene_type:complete
MKIKVFKKNDSVQCIELKLDKYSKKYPSENPPEFSHEQLLKYPSENPPEFFHEQLLAWHVRKVLIKETYKD